MDARSDSKGSLLSLLILTVLAGLLATFFLDVWNFTRHFLFGYPLTNYQFNGRWLLHMLEGEFCHDSIKAASPVPFELAVGWMGHYAIGVLFALMLSALWGWGWYNRPRLIPAMIIGMITIVIPFFIMQPCMGAGLAGHLAPDPMAVRIKVLISHLVFGIGLYAAGWVLLAGRKIFIGVSQD